MSRSITTVVATMAVSGFVHAQDAVQWTEAEGGNGHWYQRVPTSPGDNFDVIRQNAVNVGADLASITSSEEDSFVAALANGSVGLGVIIGTKVTDPECDIFTWSDGSEWTYENWGISPPQPDCVLDEAIGYYADGWHDLKIVDIDAAIFEWSADCNGDGIVDYGQILNGSLADKDGNGVPDCCDNGISCAIQWKVEDGGNDNWYRFVKADDLVAWDVAASDASNLGGHLATITTPDENQFIVDNFDGLGSGQAWIGLFQNTSSPDYSEPGGGWEWVTQEPFNWNNWTPGEPNNSGKGEQSEEWGNIWLTGGDQPNYIGFWNDNVLLDVNRSDSYLIEWSADCNGDGIVDYGQILDGSLLDENGNGIPDICQQFEFGACCYNGGCVLTTNAFCFEAGGSYAGDGTLCTEVDCPTTCPGDIDGDGQVGVIDILIVIDRWGFCP